MQIDRTQLYCESLALRSGDPELLRGAATYRVDLVAQVSAPSTRDDMLDLVSRHLDFLAAAYEATLLLDLTGLQLWNTDDLDEPEYAGYVIAAEDWDDWEDEYGGGRPYPCRVLALGEDRGVAGSTDIAGIPRATLSQCLDYCALILPGDDPTDPMAMLRALRRAAVAGPPAPRPPDPTTLPPLRRCRSGGAGARVRASEADGEAVATLLSTVRASGGPLVLQSPDLPSGLRLAVAALPGPYGAARYEITRPRRKFPLVSGVVCWRPEAAGVAWPVALGLEDRRAVSSTRPREPVDLPWLASSRKGAALSGLGPYGFDALQVLEYRIAWAIIEA